jgi:hypothetical protein
MAGPAAATIDRSVTWMPQSVSWRVRCCYRVSIYTGATHSGPDGGRATFDGWHGSMKPEGRRDIMVVLSFGATRPGEPLLFI